MVVLRVALSCSNEFSSPARLAQPAFFQARVLCAPAHVAPSCQMACLQRQYTIVPSSPSVPTSRRSIRPGGHIRCSACCSGVHCIVSTSPIDVGSQVFSPFLDNHCLLLLLPTTLLALAPNARAGMGNEGAKPFSRSKGGKRPIGNDTPPTTRTPAPAACGVWQRRAIVRLKPMLICRPVTAIVSALSEQSTKQGSQGPMFLVVCGPAVAQYKAT